MAKIQQCACGDTVELYSTQELAENRYNRHAQKYNGCRGERYHSTWLGGTHCLKDGGRV